MKWKGKFSHSMHIQAEKWWDCLWQALRGEVNRWPARYGHRLASVTKQRHRRDRKEKVKAFLWLWHKANSVTCINASNSRIPDWDLRAELLIHTLFETSRWLIVFQWTELELFAQPTELIHQPSSICTYNPPPPPQQWLFLQKTCLQF